MQGAERLHCLSPNSTLYNQTALKEERNNREEGHRSSQAKPLTPEGVTFMMITGG
jgi:hypothetical protein